MMESILSRLQGLLEQLEALARNYLLGHAYFITGEYYERLFTTYFSVTGFLVGLAFLAIVFFATGKEGDKRTGFFKVVPFVAVINSCGILMDFLNGVFIKASHTRAISCCSPRRITLSLVFCSRW